MQTRKSTQVHVLRSTFCVLRSLFGTRRGLCYFFVAGLVWWGGFTVLQARAEEPQPPGQTQPDAGPAKRQKAPTTRVDTDRQNPNRQTSPQQKPASPRSDDKNQSETPQTRKAKPEKTFQIASPTQRFPLALIRFRQLREVIRMLEWVTQRGWLQNLDIQQLKLVEQWLQGRIAKLLGIQWERGLWLKLYATNSDTANNKIASLLKPWPLWLPPQYKRYVKFVHKLQQCEVILEIPVKRSFWLGFAIRQVLGLSKVPFQADHIGGYQTYWLNPPLGIPAVMVLGQRYIYLRLLWPTPAITTAQGRRALWKALLAPSLFFQGKALKTAQKRIQKEYSSQTIVVTYLSVSLWFRWLQDISSRSLQQLARQFNHLEGYSIGGHLTLSSLQWKSVQWRSTRQPSSPKQKPKRAQSTPKEQPTQPTAIKTSTSPTQAKPGNGKARPKAKPRPRNKASKRKSPVFVPPAPPRGLPFPNPLFHRHVPGVSNGTGREKGHQGGNSLTPRPRRPYLSPLPLVFMTWPQTNTVFVGSFSQGKKHRDSPSTLIRRLLRIKQRTPPQQDVFGLLLRSIEKHWRQQSWLAGSWISPRQLAQWTLESLMFQQWMLWGELSAQPSSQATRPTPARKPGSQPPTRPQTQKSSPQTARIHVVAVGRWDDVAQRYLQPMLRALAQNKGSKALGSTPTLRFPIAANRPALYMTWRGSYWFMADSTRQLQRILQLYTRKQRGPFLDDLPTDSVLYRLEKQRHWNILHLRPSHLYCLMQRSLTGQIAGLISRQVESVELASLQEGQQTTLLLQMRWDTEAKAPTTLSCLPPAATWRHLTPTLLAPFQQSFLWQLAERLNQMLQLDPSLQWKTP